MSRSWRRLSVVAAAALFGLANLATQRTMLAGSAAPNWTGMLRELRTLALPSQAPVEIGLQDLPKPQLVALYTHGHPTWSLAGTLPRSVGGAARTEVAVLAGHVFAAYHALQFDLGAGAGGPSHHFERFEPPDGLSGRNGIVILPSGDESVVNGSQKRPATGRLYAATRADLRNTLVEVDSSLGHIILPGIIENIGLWQREGDFAGSPGGIQGIGRHVLFEVINPVPGSRFLLDYTAGALAGDGVPLPPAVIVGTERLSLGLEGRGAGRVLSEPVAPQEIDGHFYLALDLGADASRFRSERHGLAALYNAQLGDDPRYLCGFVRNISLLTPDQVAAIAPPPAVTGFPAGLMAQDLLFSGIAEDGWIADQAWFELALPGPSDMVHIIGDVPGFSPKILAGMVKILIDGTPVAEGKLMAGSIDVTIPIPEKPGPREIGFEITGTDTLPPPDGRVVSIHLTSLSLGKKG